MSEGQAKRRLQFNLRTLLWLMLVVAAFFGGWQAHEWKRRREMEAIQLKATIMLNGRTMTLDPAEVIEIE